MQINLLWTGREYYSLENCVVTITETGTEANSVIIGMYDQKIYRIDYKIKTNKNWETTGIELKMQLENKKNHWFLIAMVRETGPKMVSQQMILKAAWMWIFL